MYILTLGVLAPYRGLGIGSQLLARCLARCEECLPEVGEAYLHVQVRWSTHAHACLAPAVPGSSL